MENNRNVQNGGIGFFGLLTIVFVVAKLLEWGPAADWSWWLVFAPIWGPVAFFFVIAAGALCMWGVVKLLDKLSAKRRMVRDRR